MQGISTSFCEHMNWFDPSVLFFPLDAPTQGVCILQMYTLLQGADSPYTSDSYQRCKLSEKGLIRTKDLKALS